MVWILYDKTNPKNVWFAKGMGIEEAKRRTNIPRHKLELLKVVANSEIQVLNNAPVVHMKV